MKYTNEKQVQLLIALLKENKIKKIIASPGTTNITFVKSLQNDDFFEMYSCVDERSAAYMACGLSAESGEPVVLTCTGATASRNYMSGLTEAFYRKLPILAVTATQEKYKIGHNIAQILDRSVMPNDAVRHSVHIPLVKDSADEYDCEIKINNALLELNRDGGGPVHINLTTNYSKDYSCDKLPKVRNIKRYAQNDKLPELPKGSIGIFIGAHTKMNAELEQAIDSFCLSNNAVVFCDYSSGYNGKYRINHSLSSSQRMISYKELSPKLTIHIGEITGDYSTPSIIGDAIWRVSEDGQLRDPYKKLAKVFQMPEAVFFNKYTNQDNADDSYFNKWNDHMNQLRDKIPDVPFSNIWTAMTIHKNIPENSVIHFAILNSLRSWNLFDLSKTIKTYSNVGGFGIDGCLSSLLGASFANPQKLHFGIIGDLSFFYDMNALGNRHLGNNLRILLINNGAGTEFKNFNHYGHAFGDDTDKFIAARGHFGNQSTSLVKNYSESLGFEYITASNKSEFEEVADRFLTKELTDKPILFEIFTDSQDESKALEIVTGMEASTSRNIKEQIKNVLGDENIKAIKKAMNRNKK